MEKLRELVYVVDQYRTKHVDLLDPDKHAESKVNQLYRALSEDELDSDDEIFQNLYPGKQSKSAFNNLKSHLREKLLNTLFFLESGKGGSSDRQEAYHRAHKHYAAVQILLAKNTHNAALDLLEKLFRRAEHFEFTELAYMVARSLRLLYGSKFGNETKFDYYDQRVAHYEQLNMLENRAESLYTKLILAFVNSKSPKPHLAQEARAHYLELEPFLEDFTSYRLHFFAALIHLFEHTCLNDYPQVIPICEQYIKFFTAKPYVAKTPLCLLRQHQMVGYLQLQDHQQAERMAQYCRDLLEEGSFNWFSNQEYLFLLAMHTTRFQRAYELFTQAVNHKRFSYLPEYVREMWEIYRAYLHLMADLGKVQPIDSDQNFVPFRLQRFLNSIPLYAKDKRGMNISILIVQIIFYMQKGEYDKCIDRIETIKKYCARYLMKPETIRSYYFINLLLIIPEEGFHRVAVERHTANYWKKLQATDSSFSQQFHKIEIVPYELLWELVLEMLGYDRVSVRKLG